MPYINSKVNIAITEEQQELVKEKLGKAIELFSGKSESWLMVGFEEEYKLYFRGDNTKKLAFVEVKIMGSLNSSSCCKMTAAICDIFQEVLGISPDGVYITYDGIENWGYNGSNF